MTATDITTASNTEQARTPVLVAILKNFLFMQNIASFILSRISPTIEHNVQKYQALRKAFYLTALEHLKGDYLEFGVFTGSSFVFALRINRRLKALGDFGTRFFGFDSFSGFGKVDEKEKHPFYLDINFSVNQERVMRNIRNHGRGEKIELIKGYFENTLAGKSATDVGVKAARVVLIDCDLQNASMLALQYAKPVLQLGTVVLLDDFFSYKGSETRGTAGAFNEFCEANPQIKFRRIFDYGYGGVGYIVSAIS